MSRVSGQSESHDGSRRWLPYRVRWFLVEAPARLYMAGERSGGKVPWPFFAAMALLAAAGAGIGAAAAAAMGRNVADWASGGLLTGIFVMLAWSVYAILALGVMWVRGISPERAERGDAKPSGHTSEAGGRHAAPLSWRSHGDRLVPGGLVVFFLIMAAFGAWEWTSNQNELRQVPLNNRVVTTGRIVEFHEPAFYDNGPGSIVVLFDAGAPVTAEVPGNIGEHSIDVGDTVPIEYDASRPTRARVTWTREAIADDADFAKWMIAVTGALAIISAVAWLAGGRRARRES